MDASHRLTISRKSDDDKKVVKPQIIWTKSENYLNQVATTICIFLMRIYSIRSNNMKWVFSTLLKQTGLKSTSPTWIKIFVVCMF